MGVSYAVKGLLSGFRRFLGAERGQSVVIFTFSLVALLLFAGLAVDMGAIFIGREDLSRAVDAAVLAGVAELPRSGKGGADVRAQQYLDANKIDFDSGLLTFESSQSFSGIGAWRYHITVTRQIDLFFLPLINFDHVVATGSAIAEYDPQLEMYTDQPGQYEGMQNSVNLMNWGPDARRTWGDAYTPVYASDAGDPNPYWDELEGVYGYRIHVPASYPEQHMRVELFDPDCFNVANADVDGTLINHSGGVLTDTVDLAGWSGEGYSIDREDALVYDQSAWDPDNRFWFARIDENRRPWNGAGGGYNEGWATTTAYELYYYTRLPDGTIITQTLAIYVKGGAEADSDTDMSWVCPGGSLPQDPPVTWGPQTFEIDLDALRNDPTHPIYVDPSDGHVSLFLNVQGVAGSSENGWDLWAGPINASAPANVNERNLWLITHPDLVEEQDPITYSRGHMPWNINVNDMDGFIAKITYLGPEMAGRQLSVAHFDNDAGAEAITYTIDTIPFDDWHEGGLLSGNDQWLTETFYIPGPPTHTFYGGYLEATYFGGYQDTSVWKLEASGFPVLIK